ncbi:N-acetyllactosaminide beta-1,3-N-acetylglucosaminyltransferase 3-like [Elgaria multicarinata webbii]|uniref:N-acetyllactosaminide beta-1,3-N-acetylglucosaminyltransferase 3-like n=1 Tax=Elgaria multicarinata webbii TaxID=159646 RepID=UPI002FCD0815
MGVSALVPFNRYMARQRWVTVGLLLSIALYSSLRKWQSSQEPRLVPATLTDGTFTFRLDRSAYDAAFPHLQRYTCREEIAPEGLCQGPAGAPLLLLAVKSHPASGGRRAALRRTWARPREMGGFQLRPIFLMATASDHRHARLVQLESDTFGDVLMWDFVESPHNLSLKDRCFLQWLHGRCPQAAYVFKGDDSIFVNLKGLTEYLAQTPNASRFIHGTILYHSVVQRVGKYMVPQTLYPFQHYPNFAAGGVILPGKFIAALYNASLQLPVFPLDDVYLGFLALAAGLPHRHFGHVQLWGPANTELTGSP